MARIMSVDYEGIPAKARIIRTQGQELNNEITNAYTSIANMHSSWYGKRYNELAILFNNLIPEVNELLTLTVQEIPFALETVANSYSQADSGENVANVERTEPKAVPTLAIPSDVGMKFISNEVNNIKDKVSTNFKNARSKMDEIESTYRQIDWQSEASETFSAKFTNLKRKIIVAFEEIETQFTNLMAEALNDIQNTETQLKNM